MSINSINAGFRTQPPIAGPMPQVRIGDFETLQLANGLHLIVVENHKLPKVAMQLVIDHEPFLEGNIAGVAGITGELLGRGTKDKSKVEIDNIIDYYGANFHTSSDGIFGSVLKKYLNPFLDVFSHVLLTPSFPIEEFNKIKLKHRSRLQTVRNEPGEIAFNVCTKINYGNDHPYGDILTSETLENISLNDCQSYYADYWKPSCSYLVVIGDITLQEVESKISPLFDPWEASKLPIDQYKSPKPPSAIQFCLTDRPNAVQSEVRVTYPIEFHPASKDRMAASVMNQILGGGVFSGYLMQNLREDKGYTYGVRSRLQHDRTIGEFETTTSVGTEVTLNAIVEIQNEMRRIRTDLPDPAHLDLVKNSLLGSFARSIENPQTLANRVLNILRYNLPDDYYTTFADRLNDVTASEVQQMAENYIFPDRTNIVIVGDMNRLVPQIKELFEQPIIREYDAFGKVLTTNN